MAAVSRVFLWCFIVGIVFVWGWGGVFLFLRLSGIGYDINAAIFGVSPHEFDLMHFYGLTFVKILVFWCFLVPYIAIRLAMFGTNSSEDV
jgi:hypothetical protein